MEGTIELIAYFFQLIFKGGGGGFEIWSFQKDAWLKARSVRTVLHKSLGGGVQVGSVQSVIACSY